MGDYPLRTYPPAMNSAVADGKPHKRYEVNLAAESDIKPLKLLHNVTSTTFDLCPAAATNLATAKSTIWISDIPTDHPNIDKPYSQDAYDASAEGVPVLECEKGRQYYLNTAVDMTGYTIEELLIPAADGDLARPTDVTPGALEYNAHGFKLKYAVSITQIVIEYEGLVGIDAT